MSPAYLGVLEAQFSLQIAPPHLYGKQMSSKKKAGAGGGCVVLFVIAFCVAVWPDGERDKSSVRSKAQEAVTERAADSEALARISEERQREARPVEPESTLAEPEERIAHAGSSPLPTSESAPAETTSTSDVEPTKEALAALIPTSSRNWTNNEGSTVLGAVTAIDLPAESVTLKLADGQVFEGYALANFAAPDQDYIRGAAKGILTGTVVGVHDGDSLTLLVAGNTQFKIRLEAIDAPELGQEFGNNAKQGLGDMVHGRDVRVEITGRDKYKRYLGFVLFDGSNVNHQMIVRGLAWHFVEYSDSEEFTASEEAARGAKSGLWSAFNPMAPWDYRDRGRLAAADKAAAAAKTETSPFPAASSTATTPKGKATNTHWLNTGSNTRHNRGCRWYGNTKSGHYCGPSDGRACGTCGG